LSMGDLPAAQPLLAKPDVPAGWRANYALLQRRYGEAVEVLSQALAVEADRGDPDLIIFLAQAQELAGDVSAARATYQKAVQDLQRQLKGITPGSFEEAWRHGLLGLAYAGLGEAASAIAEGQKAMTIRPISKDGWSGPVFEVRMAEIYAKLADADHAIPILQRVLQLPCGFGITPALLRLAPIWDPIRNNPRFQELAAEKASLPEKSIAVLPFENLSKDEENAFFAGGVQDEILTNLAKVGDLKVISRTSVMKYKSDLERNLRQIATTLGVSHVVEGSVQRAGGRIRVNAQLIDARNDTHLWAEHYDRDVADVFAIQSEIAQQIANQLQAKLSPAEKAAIGERPTTDPVAYAYYTRAKEMDRLTNWEGNEKNLNQKVELLEKAIQRDPNFALAYCALAKAQLDLFSEPDRKAFELAKKATETALRLRPDLAEPHLALARYYWFTGPFTDPPEAVTYYDRAREELAIVRRKLPNNAEALMIEAEVGRHQNRWDASLANLRRASELDPQNGEITYRLQQIYGEMRRYSELEQFIRKRPASDSRLPGRFNWLAVTKLAQGDPVAAQSLMEQVPLEFSPGEWIWDTRFKTALYLRDYEAAIRVIAATPAKWADTAFGEQTSSWAEGQVARARGDKEKALAAFADARKKIEVKFGSKPEDAPYLSQVATLDAGLGRKEEAIREARRAVELLPIAKDSLNGPGHVAILALVYAWTGEGDRALEQLEKIATIPGNPLTPTYGDLLLNPCWDDLRGDPRFDKIVAAAKAASR
jgi:TolB-like protein